MIEWIQLCASENDPEKKETSSFSISLSTEIAKQPICLRVINPLPSDKLAVKIGHLDHTPFSSFLDVDTFVDIWVDPFEFDCSKYGLEKLPKPLHVELVWTASHVAPSVWTPRNAELLNDWKSVVSCSKSQPSAVCEKQESELSTVTELAHTYNTTPERIALFTLFVSMFHALQTQDLGVHLEDTREASRGTSREASRGTSRGTSREASRGTSRDVGAVKETSLDAKSLARMALAHASKYWPAFKESKITSWISTVVNSIIQQMNDEHDAGISEDFDVMELIRSWYPSQPWTAPEKPMSDSISSINAMLESFLMNKCQEPSWRESIEVAALAMALPYTSVCLPNKNPLDMPFAWSHGAVARNILYGYIFYYLGTDPLQWLSRFGITPATMRKAVQWITNLTFAMSESNIEMIAKRIITIIMQHYE